MPQENVTFQQLFDQALSVQQQKNWDEALKLYQQALDQGQNHLNAPQLSTIYHNMSTVAFEKSEFLNAYVWSKKALALDPGNRMAQQAFEGYAKKFEVPSIPHQISTSQNFQKMLEKVPVDILFGLCLVLFFATMHLFFKNILSKRKDQIDLVMTRPFAWKPLVSFTLLVVFVALCALRWNLDQKIYAIVTIEKTGIQTAAGENRTVIFEAQPGLEVEVLQISENYAQVRYPGAFSGWVPLKNIEILSLQNALK